MIKGKERIDRKSNNFFQDDASLLHRQPSQNTTRIGYSENGVAD